MFTPLDALKMWEEMKNPHEKADVEIVQELGDGLFYGGLRFVPGPAAIAGAVSKISTEIVVIPVVEEHTSYFEVAAEEGKRVERALTWAGVENQGVKTAFGSFASGVATATPAATLLRNGLLSLW